jgi:peptidoglycan/xylan/chitin deacetylase (PgdA/CDA1 family)
MVDAIRAWAGDVDAPSDSRPLGADEVRLLAEGPLVEIGGHSVTHPSLPRLDSREQAREIAENKAQLEALLDRPLRHFAYPHGDYGDDTVALVEAAGYRSACTCDVTAISRTVAAFRLPRIGAEDWSGPEFADRLGQRFAGSRS